MGQEDIFPDAIAPAPESTQLAKYVDQPIGYYTGIPEISVPLWTIKEHDIELPIALSYHAGGVKVNEVATWVGLNWSLIAGGAITRSVRGVSDDLVSMNGFLTDLELEPSSSQPIYQQQGAYDLRNPNVENNPFYRLHNSGSSSFSHNKDSSPDIFYFNFNGYSGKFVFSKEVQGGNILKYIHLIPYQDIEIQAQWGVGGSIVSFTGKTSDGLVYQFNEMEVSSSLTSSLNVGSTSSAEFTYNSAWFLTSIYSSKTGADVELVYHSDDLTTSPPTFNSDNFSYYTQGKEVDYEDVIVQRDYDDPMGEVQSHKSTTLQFVGPPRLKEIVSKSGKVVFESAGQREDVYGRARILTGVKIYNSLEEEIKSYHLGHKYLNGNSLKELDQVNCSGLICPESYRLMLTSVREHVGSAQLPPYQFDYHLGLPSRSSMAQDFWGYYNGATANTTLIPTLYDKFGKGIYSIYYGANRSVMLDQAQKGTLKSMTFPTGGSRAFLYESNQVESPLLLPYLLTETTKTWEIQTTTIKNQLEAGSFSASSTFVINSDDGGSVVRMNFSNLLEYSSPQSDIWRPYTLLIYKRNASGTYVEHNTPDIGLLGYLNSSAISNKTLEGYFSNGFYKIELVVDYFDKVAFENLWFDYYHFCLGYGNCYQEPENCQGSEIPQVVVDCSSASIFIKIINKDRSKLKTVGGLRIREIQDYAKNQVLVKRRSYEYQTVNENSSGAISAFPPFLGMEIIESILLDCPSGAPCSDFLTGGGMGPGYQGRRIELFATPSLGLNTTKNGHVGYARVKEIYENFQSSINSGSKVYEFINPKSSPDYLLPGSFGNSYLSKLFPFSEATDRDWTRGLLNYTAFYDDAGSILEDITKYYSIEEAMIDGGITLGYLGCNISDIYPAHAKSFLGFNFIEHSTGHVYMDSSIRKVYDPYDADKHLKVKEMFDYNPINYLPNNITTTFSDGRAEEEHRVYSVDENGASSVITELNTRHIHNAILEKEVFVNGQKVSGRENLYKIDQNNIVLDEIFEFNNISLDYEPKVKFHRYDSYTNPVEVSRISDPLQDSHTVYIWGYDGQYPLAKIENSSYSQLSSAFIADLKKLETNNYDLPQDRVSLQNLNATIRSKAPLESLVSTYTYAPLKGRTSETDANGMTIFYSYDVFGRLVKVQDKDGNILSANEYHYKSQD